MKTPILVTATAAVAAALTLTACDPSVQAADPQITFTAPSPEVMAEVERVLARDAEHTRLYGYPLICEDDPTNPYIQLCHENPDYAPPVEELLPADVVPPTALPPRADEPQRFDGEDPTDFRCAVDSPEYTCRAVYPGDPRYDAAPPMVSEPATNPITIDWEEAMAELEGETR